MERLCYKCWIEGKDSYDFKVAAQSLADAYDMEPDEKLLKHKTGIRQVL